MKYPKEETCNSAKRVLVIGESIYLAAITSVLRQHAGIQLIYASDTCAPDAILIATHDSLTSVLACFERYPGTPVIAIDEPTQTLTTISGVHAPAQNIQDLVRAIQNGAASTTLPATQQDQA